MHTSTRLTATDFQFWRTTAAEPQSMPFTEFCPHYHELDRVGVVSPRLEDGVCQTGRTLLALTTAFYDCQRTHGNDFFDYPQHFAFVGVTAQGLQCGDTILPLERAHLWDAWSWLDVWPANKWITVQPTATALLERVFDFQINRLFWPRQLHPQAGEAQLPAYVYKMLRSRLRTVYTYDSIGSCTAACGEVAVSMSPTSEALFHESLAQLPSAAPRTVAVADRLQPVAVDHFITAMQAPGLPN